MSVSLFRLAALAAFASSAVHAGVVAPEWPGVGACAGTLQACIDATPADAPITVVATAPIDESLSIQNRGLVLRAAPGQRARFAPGRSISVSTWLPATPVVVDVSGVDLVNACLTVDIASAGGGSIEVHDVSATQTSPTATPACVRVGGGGGDTVTARVRESRFVGNMAGNSGLLTFTARESRIEARGEYNTFRAIGAGAGAGAGVWADYYGDATGFVRLHGNRLEGDFGRSAIFFSEGLATSTASEYTAVAYSNVVVGPIPDATPEDDFSNGIDFVVGAGTLRVQAINNTLTRVYRGISVSNWDGAAATVAVEGVLANNVIVAAHALSVNPAFRADVDNHHNLINTATVSVPLGPDTITAPAGLVSLDKPRLRDDSPAIDAADTTLIGLGIIVNAMPITDADGLRRIKGASPAKADIGAYEWGDEGFAHVTQAGNTGLHITRLAHRTTDDTPGAFVFAQPARNAARLPSVAYQAPYGVFYQPASDRWALFSQDFSTMPIGARMHAFVPAPGGGLLRHTATEDNVLEGANFTRVEASGLDNLEDRIVIVTQNYEPGHVYNAHPVGTFFNGSNWFVDNVDGAAMPIGASFNVYYQEPSPNAFRVRPPAGTEIVDLRHPLLDGNACARPLVTRQYEGEPGGGYELRYVNNGWRIDAVGPVFDGETTFHVLVDAPRADPCDPPLFADGFEND